MASVILRTETLTLVSSRRPMGPSRPSDSHMRVHCPLKYATNRRLLPDKYTGTGQASMRRPHVSILPASFLKKPAHFNPCFHTHSVEPTDASSMQVKFRVEAWRCNLSHELEAHSLRRSRQEIRVSSTRQTRTRLHTILGKGLKLSPVTHIR